MYVEYLAGGLAARLPWCVALSSWTQQRVGMSAVFLQTRHSWRLERRASP